MITPTVAVVIIQNNQVLLVRHNQQSGNLIGLYGLPAGRIDPLETEKEAAVRELQEETGLIALEEELIDFPDNMYVASIIRKRGEQRTFSMRAFICNTFTGKLQGNEETTPEWVEIDKIQDYNILPNTKEAVEDALLFLNSKNAKD